MFDLVNKHRKFVQILLAMITLPFAFWGIDSYFKDAASTMRLPVSAVARSPCSSWM